MGAYADMNDEDRGNENDDIDYTYGVDDIVASEIRNRKSTDRVHALFKKFDRDADGILSEADFVKELTNHDHSLTESEGKIMFHEADNDHSGTMDYNDFVAFLQNSGYDQQVKMPPSNRDSRGLIQIDASNEKYFGEMVRKYNAGKRKEKDMDIVLAQSQLLVQELYETRIASMQRFVAMCVFFHHISKRVERFFAKISFGFWAYRLDRTHSIVRIATTASPIR